MNEMAEVCLNCGVKKGTGFTHCAVCGDMLNPGSVVCLKCGAQVAPQPSELKSKMVAGLLGILLGGFGIHNFYLGFNGRGIAQIILTFCFGIGAIWGLVEGIMIFAGAINKDAKGNPLTD